jgi:hypothetical protein
MSKNHDYYQGSGAVEAKKQRGHDKKWFGNVINGIRRNPIPNISKKIFIHFSLVFLVIFFVGIGLIHEVGRDSLQKEIAESIVRQFPADDNEFPDMSEVTNILERVQYRVILGISVLFLCVIASMYVFMRYFVRPLDNMGKTVHQMTKGHLDEMVSVCANNEINKIGELINDLAINLQEILLHVWSHTGQDIVLLDRIVEVCGTKSGGNGILEEIKDDLRIVRQDIEDMQNMVKAFDYYNIRFEKEKIIAGEKHNPEKL